MPYWTNNCIDSMEGLYFESSATTPYHFLDQAELSVSPSDPMVGLPYGGLDVAFGVEHLQMLGVRYYIAFSPAVIKQANRDPELTLIAKTKKWPAPGDQWFIYKIASSPMVAAAQERCPTSSPTRRVASAGSNANTTWWLNPETVGDRRRDDRAVELAHGRQRDHDGRRTRRCPRPPSPTRSVGLQSISFHVSRIGVPVLVKISYFPRWHATGATGPYRVSPNLMVVIPTVEQRLDGLRQHAAAHGRATTSAISTALAGVVALFFYIRRRGRATSRRRVR